MGVSGGLLCPCYRPIVQLESVHRSAAINGSFFRCLSLATFALLGARHGHCTSTYHLIQQNFIVL